MDSANIVLGAYTTDVVRDHDAETDVVREHDAEAAMWYRLGAEQGEAEAQITLGLMYENGDDVPQNYVEAHKWYSLAAAGDQPGEVRDWALRNRDNVEAKMTPSEIAEAQRLAREWKRK